MTAFAWADAEQSAVRRDDGALVPADPTNRDFAAIDPASIAPFQQYATLEAAKVGKLADLAHRRWLAEQDFSFEGMPLALDDGTQRRIGAAIQYLDLSSATSVRWQVTRGVFATFSAATLNALGVAAGAHVQACFANVEILSEAIEAAADFAALEAVDIDHGWP